MNEIELEICEKAKELYREGKTAEEVNEILKNEYPDENFDVSFVDNGYQKVDELVENRINDLFKKLKEKDDKDAAEELDILLKHHENLEKIKQDKCKQEEEKSNEEERRKAAVKEALIKGGFAIGSTVLSVGAWIGISLLTGRLESTGTLFRSSMGKNKPIKF